MEMYLSDMERLAIIAGCLGFVALCVLVMVCKLSPHCCLYKYCPLRAKYDEEKETGPFSVPQGYYQSLSGVEPLAVLPLRARDPRRQKTVAASGEDSTGSETEDPLSSGEHDKELHKTAVLPTPDKTVITGSGTACFVKGELELLVYYSPEFQSHLQVHILRLKNLVFKECDKVKVGIKIQLLKEESNFERFLSLFSFLEPSDQLSNVEFEAQTTLKGIDSVPEWEEPKLIPLERSGCERRVLRLVCCLFDKYSQVTQLGEVLIKCSETTLDRETVLHRVLRASHQEVRGELLLSVSYLPTAQKLVIQPMECRQIKLLDASYPSSVYLRVALVSRGTYTKKKTTEKESQTRLIWNEPVHFSLPNHQLLDITVLITVKQSVSYPDKTRVKNIGQMALGLTTGSQKAREQWHGMLQAPRELQAVWHTLH